MLIGFPTVLFGTSQATPATRVDPLSRIFPSQAIFDLDATIGSSYTSGQVWHNIIPAPADGSLTAAYDFNRGATSAGSTDDPTFNGSANDAAAYWSLDGGDQFSLADTFPPFLNNIHKGIDPYTLVIAMNIPLADESVYGLFSTTDTSDAANVGISFGGGYNAVFFEQRVLLVNVTGSRGGLAGNSVDLLLIVSYDPAINEISIWDNNLAKKNQALVYTVNASSHIGTNALIGAGLPTGSRLYGVAALKMACTDVEAAKLYTFYNTRHARTYV